jgi:adenylosuccinate synthase
MLRSGFRVCDLVDGNFEVDKGTFWKKLNADPLFGMLEEAYGVKVSREEVAEKAFKAAETFKGSVHDTRSIIQAMLAEGKNILFEGAQGTFLDIDHGTYPYVTSSNTTVGGVFTGTGVRFNPTRVVGLVKAYTTRVGEGPFLTELHDETGKHIREKGNEFGATTGRPRRVGWYDNVLVREAIEINGVTELALTKADVLSDLPGGKVKFCYRYKMGSHDVVRTPSRMNDFEACEPCYTSHDFDAWSGDLRGVRRREDLPRQLQFYMNSVEQHAGSPIRIMSVGPKRDQTIYRR